MLCHNLQTTILLTKTFYRHQLKNKHFATISSVERDLSRLRARKPRRVLFNVPGSDEKKIKKALTLDADCLVLDFEDGVALNQKEKARSLVCHYIIHAFSSTHWRIYINTNFFSLYYQKLSLSTSRACLYNFLIFCQDLIWRHFPQCCLQSIPLCYLKWRLLSTFKLLISF